MISNLVVISKWLTFDKKYCFWGLFKKVLFTTVICLWLNAVCFMFLFKTFIFWYCCVSSSNKSICVFVFLMCPLNNCLIRSNGVDVYLLKFWVYYRWIPVFNYIFIELVTRTVSCLHTEGKSITNNVRSSGIPNTHREKALNSIHPSLSIPRPNRAYAKLRFIIILLKCCQWAIAQNESA